MKKSSEFCSDSLSLNSKVLSPVGKLYVLWDVFSTRRDDVIILEMLSRQRNTEFGYLHFGVTESPMGDPSITQPYEPAIHDVLAPAVSVGVVNVL